VDTCAWCHYKDSARQADTTATETKAANGENIMTLTITTFNQLQPKPLVCMVRSPPPFLGGLIKKLVDDHDDTVCLVTPVSGSGPTNTCP